MKTIELKIPVFGSDQMVTRRVDDTPEALATGGYHPGERNYTNQNALNSVILERYLGNGRWLYRRKNGTYGTIPTRDIKGLSVEK